ncbi:MAG: hypothetical protein IJV69_01670 [Kiritimatiellae bacterium]|nr:hypothetical protein [Kiritimatiellia bacterium]
MQIVWQIIWKRLRLGIGAFGFFIITYLILMICSCRLRGPVCWITYIPFAESNYFQKRGLEYKTGFAIWIDERRWLNGDFAFYYYAHSQVFKLDNDDIMLLQKMIPELLELDKQDENIPYEALGLQLGFYESRVKNGTRLEFEINAYGYRLKYHSRRHDWHLTAGQHTTTTLQLWEKYSQHHTWRDFSSFEKQWLLEQRAHNPELRDVEGDIFALKNTIGNVPIETRSKEKWNKTTLKFWDKYEKEDQKRKLRHDDGAE